jgi:hypothetical protein
MAARGIEEFFIWGKSELEDMLFQPKNDRLLFAYFGIALQPRRRGAATVLRSEIAKRKQLASLMGDAADNDGTLVLLRDPTDERYPAPPTQGEPPPRWCLCRAISIKKPGHLIVLRRQHLAAVSADGEHWDAFLDFDAMLWQAQSELQSKQAWSQEARLRHAQTPHGFWTEYIDEPRRAYLQIHQAIPLERILAIDLLGDGSYPVPHLLVEFTDTEGPFIAHKYARLMPLQRLAGPIDLAPSVETRIEIFPKTLPGEDDPPPTGFDDTASDAPPLPQDVRARLSTLLTPVARQNVTNEDDGAPERSEAAKSSEKSETFRLWCDAIARPAFSAFAMSLRATGHSARVIVQVSLGPEHTSSIEIRIKPRGTHYLSAGHVRISCAAYMPQWGVDIAPMAREVQTAYGTPKALRPSVTANTTAEDLYALLLTVLERMKSAGA